MTYNGEHCDTFKALLQMYGLPQQFAENISYHLAHIDNGQQDKLIREMVIALQKKQDPQ